MLPLFLSKDTSIIKTNIETKMMKFCIKTQKYHKDGDDGRGHSSGSACRLTVPV